MGVRGRDAELVVVVVVLASAFPLAMTILPENAKATTLFVGGSGVGNFTTIQSAIDVAIPGDTIYVFNGTYNENVVVTKTLSLIGEDRENTVVVGDVGETDVIQIVADWVNLTGFTATGSKVGIELDYVENCRVFNNNVHSNEMVGISLMESPKSYVSDIDMRSHDWVGILATMADNSIFRNITASQNGGGISLSVTSNSVVVNSTGLNGIYVGGYNNTILNNTMVDSGVNLAMGGSLETWISHTIDSSNTVAAKPVYYWKNVDRGSIPSDAGQAILANCSDILIEGFDFTHLTKAVQIGYSSNITIVNNTISRNSLEGLYLFNSDNSTVVGNNFSYNSVSEPDYEWWYELFSTVYLLRSNDNTITHNTISWSYSKALTLEHSHRNTIANNSLSESNLSALLVLSSDENTIEGNTVISNMKWDYHNLGFSGGMVMTGSKNNTVINNTQSSSHVAGLALYGSNANRINGNTVLSNQGYGIYLNNTRENIIRGNNASHNSVGLYAYVALSNLMMDNTVFDNGVGGWLLSSRRNSIHYNKFIDNAIQGIDDDINAWDNGYPFGGNYWSDYSGSDSYSGPDQDVPGGDGIGDVPYPVDLDTQDRYPLMSPLVPLLDVPSSPQKLQTDPFHEQITLIWNAPFSDGGLPITNYRIYRGTASGEESHLTDIGNDLTYVDTGLTNGQTHYYQVSAINDLGEGPRSNEASATPSTRPGAPTNLTSFLSGFASENVTISWSLSDDDGRGQNTVVRYEIYKNMTYDSNGLGYKLAGSVSSGRSEVTIKFAGEGDPNNYYYRVCSVDLNGLMNCTQDQAAKYTRPLSQGVNLVSIPLVQLNESTEEVLQTLKFDRVWSYDSLSNCWESYMTFKPTKGGLRTINHEMSLWVNATGGSNLTVAGVVPSVTTIQLKAGWNFVGFPSFDDAYSVYDLKVETGATRVEGLDPSAPPLYLRVLNDIEYLQVGHGYWVHVESDTTWTVDNH